MREAKPLGASPGAFPTNASEIACFEAGVWGAAAGRSLSSQILLSRSATDSF